MVVIAEDADADGICDDVTTVWALDAAACATGQVRSTSADVRTSPQATATDGNQLTPWACGDCAEDADADGICDDVDDCVGDSTLAACATDQVRSTSADVRHPRATASDGNQLDALGVCGGDCAEDADADGICDDVDDCVGALDACGVCNGPGEIYECGCA